MLAPGEEIVDLEQVDPPRVPAELLREVRTASARPYIGELSTTVAPASRAVVTTASAVDCPAGGRSNTRQVPRPTTGRSIPVRPNGRASTETP
jgi:hypothetical protein